MGAWGTGSFENDTAADWLDDLNANPGLAYLQQAFSLPAGYLESDQACCALAAAEVVLALAGKPRPGLHEAAKRWAAENSTLDPRTLKEAAASAIIRLLGSDSELDELWSDSEDYADWKADVEMLLGAIDQI